METVEGWADYVGREDPALLCSEGVPSSPFPRAERGLGQGPSPAQKEKGCQAKKGTAMLSTEAVGQTLAGFLSLSVVGISLWVLF